MIDKIAPSIEAALAGSAEAADHDGGAVGYVRQGGRRACNKLRDHDVRS